MGRVVPIIAAMQRVSTLERWRLTARDGDGGRVCDVYFETPGWKVRHLVVRTDHSRVLIAPRSVRAIDAGRGLIHTRLTRADIESSPAAQHDRPVSEQHRAAYGPYLGFPSYWRRPYRWGRGAVPAALRDLAAGAGLPILSAEAGDPHLRSARAVHGYAVHASDGDIGHLADLVVNVERWTIPYLVVDSHHVWVHRYVLISTEAAGPLSWEGKLVHVGLTREAVGKAPEFDPSRPPDLSAAVGRRPARGA